MKLCEMCSDHETREMFPKTEVTRCEGCGHLTSCYDDSGFHRYPPHHIRGGKQDKPKRAWKFRIRW